MIVALASVPFHRLRKLALSRNEVGDDAFVSIACAPWFAQLTHLEADNCGLGPAAVERLTKIDLSAMREIRLQENALGETGAQHLANTTLPADAYVWVEEEEEILPKGKDILEGRFENLIC
jgi:Ran GTPase-activating protein (RanGAP) involved in mRNA processing and transport